MAPDATGAMNWRRRLAADAFRHAISGPMPVSSEQEEAERNVDPIEERRPDRDLGAAHRLGDDREERAPEHRERDADERQVVEQECRLAADQRLQLHFRLEHRPAGVQQREREHRRYQQQRQEEVADIRLGERMHARR